MTLPPNPLPNGAELLASAPVPGDPDISLRRIVLASWERVDKPYGQEWITWLWTGSGTVIGHYHADLEKALTDFHQRSRNSLDLPLVRRAVALGRP